MTAATFRRPNIVLVIALAGLAVAGVLLAGNWTETGQRLFDTDDAMRLVQVREFLAGRGWFDLHEPRLQPPLGYDAHWSRLVDGGLGAMLLAFRTFFDVALAERLVRALWPLLWLFPTMAGMAAVAWRLAGREGAMVALLLAVAGIPAYQQFTPGRIDHHNVQIALSMLALASAAWSDRWRFGALAAGAFSGLAIAIGFECAPYLAVIGAGFALRHVFDGAAARSMRDYAIALGFTAPGFFLVSVSPSRWMLPACDALAGNSVATIAVASFVIAAASSTQIAHREFRAAAIAAGAVCGALTFLALGGRCFSGPYAMVDPAIWPIWLADVRENQPLIALFQKNPLTAAGIAAFPCAALLCTLALCTTERRRDPALLTAAAVFLAALATTLLAVRGFSYAMWFGMPLVAASAIALFARLGIESVPARFAAGLLFTPLALSSGAIGVAHAAGLTDRDSFTRPETRHCFQNAAYAPLARLAAGLVVADVSLGPFLLAHTGHAVMAAPYHRLSAGILAAHRALAAPPEAAKGQLAAMGADYVVMCGRRPPAGLDGAERERSLWAMLEAGVSPGWLEKLPLGEGAAFAAYRVRR